MAEAISSSGNAEIQPEDFKSEAWIEEQKSRVRIWRGIDGLTKTAQFPDGTTVRRNIGLWPKSNGYNPAIFTIAGEVRITTFKDLERLMRMNPRVRPDQVIYRKDFVVYMDYELGILRDSDGKLIDIRPDAERGIYDQIINAGLTGSRLSEAKERDIKNAAEIADSIAASDRRTSELMSIVHGKRIGYHGEVDQDSSWQDEYNREKVIDIKRLYLETEDVRDALSMLESGRAIEDALDILAKNFSESSLADGYASRMLFDEYDLLGDFYRDQLPKEDMLSADISYYAAKDALKGAYIRKHLLATGLYDLDGLRRMSTDEALEEFSLCLKKGYIDELKGGNLDMAMYKASQKQCAYLSQNYDTIYLPEDFREKYSRKDIALDAMKTDDSQRKIDYNDAKEAFAYNALMLHLKPYVTEKKFSEITTARAALNECKKYYAVIDINASPMVFDGGKVNRQQAKELKSHGEDPKAYATYEEAKEKIDSFEPTEQQIKEASRFMKPDEIEKLTRGEITQAIYENKKAYAEHMQSSVSKEIREIVEKALHLPKDQPYTYADWAKDSVAIPPTRQQLAYIHKNNLERTVEWYAKSQAERGNMKFVDANGEPVHSVALYDAVKTFHERRLVEKQNSPMDEYQKKFFRDHGWAISPDTTWKAANEAMLSTCYMEGLIGATNFKFLQSRDNFLSAELRAKLFDYGMTEQERKEFRKEINDCCNEERKKERMAKIEGVSITDTTVYGSPRNFANEYMANHKGSMKGLAEAMAKAYADGVITFPDERMVAEKGGIPSLAVGHVMASILPECVGDYTKSVERFSDLYEEAVKSKENQSKKEGEDELY